MLGTLCSKGRTFLHCQKVGEIPGYGLTHLPCQENYMLPIAAANQNACFSFGAVNYSLKLHKNNSVKPKAQNQTILLSVVSSDCRVHVILSCPPRYVSVNSASSSLSANWLDYFEEGTILKEGNTNRFSFSQINVCFSFSINWPTNL